MIGLVKLSGDHVAKTVLTFHPQELPRTLEGTCWATVASFENSWPWLTDRHYLRPCDQFWNFKGLSQTSWGSKRWTSHHQLHARKQQLERSSVSRICQPLRPRKNASSCRLQDLLVFSSCWSWTDSGKATRKVSIAIVSYIGSSKSFSPACLGFWCFWANDSLWLSKALIWRFPPWAWQEKLIPRYPSQSKSPS